MFTTECAGHTYGLGCNQSCGNCSGGVQCDHVTGSCPNGCVAGMYGDKCDLGIVIVNFTPTFFLSNLLIIFVFKKMSKNIFMMWFRIDGIADIFSLYTNRF